MRFRTLLAVGLTVLLVLAVWFAWRHGLLVRLADHDELVRSMRTSGVRGPLICIAVQFAQVVIFLIPGEITQIAAGYVFGAWVGFAYSIAGIMLGSAFNYSFARLAGRPLVEKIIGPHIIERADRALDTPRGRSALFLLFLLPGLPKDALSYGAGLSKIPLGEFIVMSGLARTPALLFSTMIGSQLYDRDYVSIAIISVIGLATIAVFYRWERKRRHA